jgi:hypothetical protein
MKIVATLLIAIVVGLVVFAIVYDSDGASCQYTVRGGGATVEAPCGLDAAGLRSYVAQHPELVAPRIPTLQPN